ncbi:MAG: D-alanyl-D-alanine carboxypeptidase [Firmicutes bacterium]|nr:D-alanyl-D-alanine carboxypeptidase [Bacillota bacterium]
MKKVLIVLIMVIMMSTNAFAYGIESVKAKGAVLIDMENGRVLWGRNEDKPLAMASTTKIMTAIIALEKCDTEDIVTVSKRAALAPEVDIDLNTGDEIKLKHLLYALMLKSANDSAIAIAEHIGGSVEDFADMMNEKAFEIGAFDTEFVTPNGLDEGNHHSTAEDMALIASYALKDKRFVDIINTSSYSFTTENGKRSFTVNNTNRLLREYNGAFGVKTGFTGKAGHCFVGAAERNGVKLVSCVLASGWGVSGKEYKWTDTKAILDYGFDNYRVYSLLEDESDTGKIGVLNSDMKQISTEADGKINALLTEEEYDNIKIIKILPESIKAPVKSGQRVGFIRIYTDDFLLGEADIVAVEDAERKTVVKKMTELLETWVL